MQSRFDNQVKLPDFTSLLNSHHNLSQLGGILVVDAPESLGVVHVCNLDQEPPYWWTDHSILPIQLPSLIQLNKFETNQYFLQNFQCTTIHVFCKICEPEIGFVYFLRVNFCFDFFRTISSSQLLQNMWIIKQTGILLWKNWRKYGSVSYSFSCTNQNWKLDIAMSKKLSSIEFLNKTLKKLK